jgi:hypothetical protein
MKKQITRISPLQTSKVFAGLYFVMTIPFILLFAMMLMSAPANARPPFFSFFILGLPFIYAIVGFIFTLIGAWAYNFIAKYIGGIEYTTLEIE